MTAHIVLDAGPLSLLAHPRRSGPIEEWATQHFTAGNRIVVPEIAYYEVRRELVRLGQRPGLERLDALPTSFPYLPITTEIVVRASELWAEARLRRRATADPKALDADVILAATALSVSLAEDDTVVVATGNVGHLAQFVDARLWESIHP